MILEIALCAVDLAGHIVPLLQMEKTQCGECGGDGKCTACVGKGGHYEIEYR